MLEGLEQVFGALTSYLTESIQGYGGPSISPARIVSRRVPIRCQRRYGPIHTVSEQAATPFNRSYELCFGFKRQAMTKSRSSG